MLLINGGYRPEIIPGVSWHPMVGGIGIRGTLAMDFFQKKVEIRPDLISGRLMLRTCTSVAMCASFSP